MSKTAQFWMTYAKIIGLIQLMHRAIKEIMRRYIHLRF